MRSAKQEQQRILLTLSNKGENARLHEPYPLAAEMPVDYYLPAIFSSN
ncbi:MAG TPA: hypothetical protein VK186_09045 [Candidatus Deferrimicrobium sp.]|nr:hypothetical protein [Candidatus Kapabacteria bacterium]HLP58964.1 hypothetical protein [Candidatus Deferrimicrobium sp.]